MSFLGGFIGGAADQATGILNKRMQDESTLSAQQAFAEFNAAVDIKKQKTLARLRQEMADEPLNRIGKKAKELEGQEVPMEAPKVEQSGLIGGGLPKPQYTQPTTANESELKSVMKLDEMGADPAAAARGIAATKSALANEKLSTEDRALLQGYMESLSKVPGVQATAPARSAETNSEAPKMRKRTADEALAAALEHAKLNDLPAYAAYDSTIGRTERENRRADSLEKREENRDTTMNRRLDIQEKSNENHTKYQDHLSKIAESRANRAEMRINDQINKTEIQNTHNTLTSVLKDIGTQEDKIQMKMMDPMLTPEQKSILEGQFKTLDRDRLNTRNELMKLAGVKPPEPVTPDRPAPNQAAIDRLIKNPDKASDFDALFGKGAAASVMSNQKPANTTSAQKPSATNPTDKPSGTISSSRNPQTGKTIYTVDGVRGRFNTREDAEDAKKKSGIGKSSMSAMIDKYQD